MWRHSGSGYPSEYRPLPLAQFRVGSVMISEHLCSSIRNSFGMMGKLMLSAGLSGVREPRIELRWLLMDRDDVIIDDDGAGPACLLTTAPYAAGSSGTATTVSEQYILVNG